jgi:hypothetical protein
LGEEEERMGASFCTVFEAEVPPFGTLGSDHRALLRAKQRLDRLAAHKGLTPLGAFESYDPADTADFLDEETQAEQPAAEWFVPAERLASVEGLFAYLDAHSDALAGQSRVVEDLSEVADELRAAKRTGVRFRFAVVM